ncbi:hypothetical protein F0P96_05735 [Hymenobacter busanensis]|uniref:Uncharacterized protein n=1 Tax=Hymenobacter busanensis TaxID=2607656 RepID=A0A7L5A4R9_9BACT|nr:hypothetical protein [Hymenobacter busanensis]KAA9338335.1 hypothetical protein F0P96_05735 [Hymenobacter busanensis]QHJ09240.1 hypothetical protein GUY19_18875 [Hymenobacter busanensis]
MLRRWTWYGGPLVGLARPSMKIENNFPYASYAGGQLVEPAYLLGQNVDARLRPLGGLQLGLESPERRWALHTEGTVRQFGGYRQQFATGYAAFPTKTYSMNAAAVAFTLGGRYQLPLRQVRVFVGAGWSITRWYGVRSGVQYDGVMSRELEGIVLPASGSFMQGLAPGSVDQRVAQPYFPHAGGPYAEAGAHYRRWTLALGYRRTRAHTFDDPSSAAFRQQSRQTGELMGFKTAFGYYATPRTSYLTVGWRLFDSRHVPEL